MTGVVLVVVLVAKAPTSFAVAIIIPLLVAMMVFIERQYKHAKDHLRVRPELVFQVPTRHERVVIPVPGLTRAVVQAVQFGRSISDDVRAVHVNEDLVAAELVREDFERQLPGVPFVIVESPYRSVVRPFVRYLDVSSTGPEEMTLVVIPEYVARHWWERILYNQTSARLRKELLGRPHTVVANVPYRREESTGSAGPPERRHDQG